MLEEKIEHKKYKEDHSLWELSVENHWGHWDQVLRCHSSVEFSPFFSFFFPEKLVPLS